MKKRKLNQTLKVVNKLTTFNELTTSESWIYQNTFQKFTKEINIPPNNINVTFVMQNIVFLVRKNCSSDREKLFLRSLEQFIQTVKVQNNFW